MSDPILGLFFFKTVLPVILVASVLALLNQITVTIVVFFEAGEYRENNLASLLSYKQHITVRLDVDEKVSEKLSMVFALCRPDEKIAAVLSLGRKARDEKRQTVIFCATMKHVEFVSFID